MGGSDRRLGGRWLFAGLVAIVSLSYLAAQLTLPLLDLHMSVVAADLIEAGLIALPAGLALWFGVFRQLRRDARAQALKGRIARAVQMAATESAVHDVVRRAVAQIAPATHTRLLLADSSEAHLKVVAEHQGLGGDQTCGVSAPFDCPAVRRAQTSRFPDPHALDACPFLLQRPGMAGSVCVPLSAVGRSIGVLHVSAPERELPSAAAVHGLEVLTEQASARLGLLRVMEQTHLQAATDPLTGLLNRRSLENQTRALIAGGHPFSLAMGDLDHFKKLNDTYGHDAGDRALRVFSRTVRGSLRTQDLVSRYGGEEFVVVLPGLSVEQAEGALQRVQDTLANVVGQGSVPSFTASWGLAHSCQTATFEELTRLADLALFRAKREGRNRIVPDGDVPAPTADAVTPLHVVAPVAVPSPPRGDERPAAR